MENSKKKEEEWLGLAVRLNGKKSIRVYLDTNILALWFIYDKKRPKYTTAKFDYRIRAALTVLDNIKNKQYSCEFVTSDWALVELVRVLVDNKIALKLFRSGHSMSHYGHLKNEYYLTRLEMYELRNLMEDFVAEIVIHGVKIVEAQGDIEHLFSRIMHYNLETGDLIHIQSAIRKCKYFVTNDGELQKKKDIAGVRLMLPDTFVNESRVLGLLNPSGSS